MTIPFCEFCKANYGGEYQVMNTKFGGIIFIYAGKDCFKINLADKARFGKYHIYHRNSNKKTYHKQLEVYNLSYGIFRVWLHDFDKTYGIPYDRNNYKRFMKDYYKLLRYQGQGI